MPEGPDSAKILEEGRIIGRLEEALSRPVWTLEEAARVTSGVFLDGTGVVLKIMAPLAWRSIHGSELDEAMKERVRYLRYHWRALDLSPQPPTEWLRRAVRTGEGPRWLVLARGRENLSKLLNLNVVDGTEEARPNSVQPASDRMRGGIARNKGTYADLVRKRIREEWERRRIGEAGPHQVSEFLTTMLEDYYRPAGNRGQERPKTNREANDPSVRNATVIRDEVKKLAAS